MALYYLLFLAFFFIIELLYFKIADRFNIIDKPNARSSHTAVTIRGGGIIFFVSALFFFFSNNFEYPCFIPGLFLIALISFLDDMITLNNKIRLAVHLIAVLLMFYQWNLFELPWFWIPVALIFVIGSINAYNFMDGVNGITGSYSLLTMGTLYYINYFVVQFISEEFLIIMMLSLLVFNFFNFRKKAKCFAGDVGSVSIAFMVIFCIGKLIIQTENFAYILLLLVYGLDAVVTIGFRLIRKENIFEAHRSHFYQYLANEQKWPHLMVSGLYFLVQLIINTLLIYFIKDSYVMAIVLVLLSVVLFLMIRFRMEGKERLIGT